MISNILRDARCEFAEEGLLTLEVADNIVTREKEGELKTILEKIFNERCGFGVAVRLVHKNKEEAENGLL